MQAAIWIDVEDICEYFRFNPHPSGIQRVAVEIVRGLIAETRPGHIRIARHDPVTLRTQEIAWDDVERMLATPPVASEAKNAEPQADAERRSRIQRAILRLPAELRGPLFRAGVLQSQVGRNVRALAAAIRPPSRELRAIPDAGLAGGPAPGDVFLVLGAPWSVPGSAALLQRLRERGVRTALLIHDVIPVRRPEWLPHARVAAFRAWLEESLPHCHTVLTISQFTADDVRDYARERGIPMTAAIRPVPAGASAPAPLDARPAGFPRPDSYVLYVSTLEARKNHALAVRVWHMLMAEVRAGTRAAESVPLLVFAGRVGMGVADLLQQLDNSRWLNGRVRLFRDPTDAEVRALYEGCRFTFMPSLYEGWGLPVQESLLLGKPCLAASGTALPESGGSLCRYFDPEELAEAHAALTSLVDEPGAVEAWQARVRAEFRPRSWRETASAIIETFVPVPA